MPNFCNSEIRKTNVIIEFKISQIINNKILGSFHIRDEVGPYEGYISVSEKNIYFAGNNIVGSVENIEFQHNQNYVFK